MNVHISTHNTTAMSVNIYLRGTPSTAKHVACVSTEQGNREYDITEQEFHYLERQAEKITGGKPPYGPHYAATYHGMIS